MSAPSVIPVDYNPFSGATIVDTAPATESQTEIWTSVQFGDDANCAFNESIALRLTGRLDKPALVHALELVISRHDALRSTFSPDGLTLIITAEPVMEFTEHDFSHMSGEKLDHKISTLLDQTATTPFHLEQGPLFRVHLAHLRADEYLLLLTSHHIVCDGWSIWVILEDLGRFYTAQSTNTMAALQPACQFSSYARQRDAARQEQAWLEDEAFWIRTFSPPPLPLELPLSGKRPRSRSFAASRKDSSLSAELIADLKQYAARQKTTLTVVLLAAFSSYLHRISRQNDPVIGVPAAGQASSGHHYLVGHCVNLLPMRCPIQSSDTFSSYLARYRRGMLEAFDHQQYTYGSLLKKLSLPRDAIHPPLVSVLFNIDQGLGEVVYGDLDVEYFTPPRAYENFELFLNGSEVDGTLQIECQYNTDLFSEYSITDRLNEFEYFLSGLVGGPDIPMKALPIVPREQEQRIAQWNNTATPLPDCGVHNLFEQQVRLHPEKTAIESSGGALTYAELNRHADALAAILRGKGVVPGTLVGICLPRSPDMVTAMLAVLKTGAAYVPLDPHYPKQRIRFMVEDAAMPLILTTGDLSPSLDFPATTRLCIDELEPAAASPPPHQTVKPDDLVYVIYTSGSTGQPKGVQVHHQAAVNFLVSMAERPGMTADDRLLAVTTLSFDIAGLEIFLPLTTGATIVLADTEQAADAFALKALIETAAPTVMQATPATWQMLLAADWQGKSELKVLCGGEPLPSALARRLLPCSGQLWNMYGPTETTIWSTCSQVTDPEDITIGRPIGNTTIHILDENLQPVPICVPGELCIGGLGLSQGYLGRDDLTAKQFVSGITQGRIYKTGDLARWREDGTLEYYNRLDHQIKIRGFRIEAGEIESALERFSGITRSAVTVVTASEGDSRLAVFYTATMPIPDKTLRDHLRSLLPAYMIPQYFVQLEKFPLTPAGKIDRKQLVASLLQREPDKEEQHGRQPEGDVEEYLLKVWSELLGHADILPEDNFFDIGGHSLLATQAVALLRKKEYRVNLRDFFEFPTIRAMARFLDRQDTDLPGSSRITAGGVREQAPLSLQQQRLWYLNKLDSGMITYNLPGARRITGPLDSTLLEECINVIMQRHAVLRTSIQDRDGHGVQVVDPAVHFKLSRIDLTKHPQAEREQALADHMVRQIRTPFDLAHTPLFRASLYTMDQDDHVFFFMPHHAVWDGWSFDIFHHELNLLYQAGLQGTRADLPELPIQYSDFAQWQRQWLQSGEVERQLEYWQKKLAGELPVLDLFPDQPRPAVMRYNQASSVYFHLDKELCDQLTEIARLQQATFFMLLLAAFKILLHRHTGGQTDLLVGVPISGRHHDETSNLIGFFVNTLVLRDRLDPRASFPLFLEQVRQTCVEGFSNQETPFEQLIRRLNPVRDTSRPPLFQTLFAYQDIRNRKTTLSDLEYIQLNLDRQGTQTEIDYWVRLSDSGITGGFDFNTDLFYPETINRMVQHYKEILARIAANPDLSVTDLGRLPEEERRNVLYEWNRTEQSFPPAATVQGLITQQASRTPDATAILSEDRRYSYQQVEKRSSRWAHRLIRAGVGTKDLVGICMERTADLPVCLVGILKAGAAYLPLDPEYPRERLSFMIQDSGVRTIMVDRQYLDRIPEGEYDIIVIDDADLGGTLPGSGPDIETAPEDPAYIIYTSGSTGKPKGVIVPHRAFSNFLLSMALEPGINRQDVVLAVTTLSFDIAGLELFLPLVSGAACVIADRQTTMDGLKLSRQIDDAEITFMQATPSTWRLMLAAGWQGKPDLKILCGGEPLPPDLASHLLNRCAELWNMYGPTETTVWSACLRITDAEPPIRIGHPIANTSLYILDDAMEPVPVGVPGELYIAGRGVALGYHNRPDLTRKVFLPDPFDQAGNQHCPGLMYRTGDRVRALPDGTLEYLERIDTQVKVRGFRIELGEIETVLMSHDKIRQAVVDCREDRPGDKRLCAYIIPETAGDINPADLRRHLRQHLPEYMIPQHFIEIGEIPLTPAGKTDRASLPAPENLMQGPSEARIAPETETEKSLACIWMDILSITALSTDDNFFDIGGHSLLAVELFAEIQRTFDLELPLALLFRAPTIQELAAQLDAELYLSRSEISKSDSDEEREEFEF